MSSARPAATEPRSTTRRTLPPRLTVALVVALLVVTNLTNNRWAPAWGLLTGPVAAALLLGVLFWSGGTWADAGLGRADLARGTRWALALIGIVAAVYLVGALLPFTRELFSDQRNNGLTGAQVADRVLIRVPIGTVLLEEVAFRGVLLAVLLRVCSRAWATTIASLLFGLWHILPSLHLSTQKPALTAIFGHSMLGADLADVGAVLFTAAAGALLCELRRRSGSLLAPMALHWSTNALGYLAGYLLALAT